LTGVDGELLGGAALEAEAEAEDVGGVRPGFRRAVAEVDAGVSVAGDVDAVGVAASAEGDVAGFAGELVGAEEEGMVDGRALGFVDGGGIAVGEVAAVEVAGREDDVSFAGVDGDGASVGVDVGDGGSGAVVDAESAVVAEADDVVTVWNGRSLTTTSGPVRCPARCRWARARPLSSSTSMRR
jgi:hypothetical protein